ncbi:hypothetical protein GFS24_17305 [Chitinophaga sp. SYP-B3965]|uniref:DUF6169 family protein n=1 Tax=Chitinophaga sp. SYP-B3965 TaxID=2663120 RepID=UPI001299B7BE|nr:DUF6169 family protein [Chitinophaga sp. SYP-B3965]MRG46882.1 hypothetical protein [Chitinophaga sp. SYP-B3965]
MPIYPYAPGPINEPSENFVFPTDLGCLYIIEFYNGSSRFDQDDLILLNSGLTYEISIKKSYLEAPPENGQQKYDSLVKPTIQHIIDNFITTKGILPIYFFICDSEDEKEAARHKLFTEKWYNESQLENWVMFSYEITGEDIGIQPYYLGLLIHTDNPNFEVYPTAFENFMENQAVQGKLMNVVRSQNS